jgi:hypothetical protein
MVEFMSAISPGRYFSSVAVTTLIFLPSLTLCIATLWPCVTPH